MKDFLIRLVLAAAMILTGFAVASSAHVQRADDDAARSRRPEPSQQSQQQPNEQTSPSSDPRTEEALAFAGVVVKESGRILLKDPVTKMNYQLDDQLKARPYIGKQVKVIGKLDLNSNTIHIDSIEPVS
ncbi:MAG TPA: DUF5818 domain-containing protein [Candidatus Sulfotelmatobacter sp.]|nr:DUF5818 domain-containing protein [Candidatus Sulfotelmatobacter sp.]